MIKIGIFLLALAAAVYGEKINYTGYRVYRVVPTSVHQINQLKVLEQTGAYDFWTDASSVGKSVDVMVAPHMVNRFSDALTLLKTDAELIIPNVQELIDQENPNYKPLSGSNRAMTWDAYYQYDDIIEWYRELAAQYPTIVTLVVVGSTYENRTIYGVRVVFNQASVGNVHVFEAGIHAREWIAPATLNYILNQWLTSTDAEVIRIRNLYETIFIPSYNPDGYAYTWSNERLWRKTRTPYGLCYGADPNRNWDYQWFTGGSSNQPCSETYAGPSAFSESETRTISQYLATFGNKIKSYIAFHSYAQLLLLPYGSSNAHVENYDELKANGDKSIAVLQSFYGTVYECGNIVDVLYVASGGSMDWVKGTYGTRITYTYELRDTGTYGFELPANQILPTATETWASVMSIFTSFNP